MADLSSRHDPSTRLIAVNHETDCAQPVNIAAIGFRPCGLRCDDDRSDRLVRGGVCMMTGPRSGLPFARRQSIVSGEVMGNQLMYPTSRICALAENRG